MRRNTEAAMSISKIIAIIYWTELRGRCRRKRILLILNPYIVMCDYRDNVLWDEGSHNRRPEND